MWNDMMIIMRQTVKKKGPSQFDLRFLRRHGEASEKTATFFHGLL